MSNKHSTLEREIEQYLVKRAEFLGGVAYKVVLKSGRGFPDRLLVLPSGWVAFVETKRPKGGRVSAQQKEIAAELNHLGFRVYFPRTYEDVDYVFEVYKRRIERDVSTYQPEPDQTTTA